LNHLICYVCYCYVVTLLFRLFDIRWQCCHTVLLFNCLFVFAVTFCHNVHIVADIPLQHFVNVNVLRCHCVFFNFQGAWRDVFFKLLVMFTELGRRSQVFLWSPFFARTRVHVCIFSKNIETRRLDFKFNYNIDCLLICLLI